MWDHLCNNMDRWRNPTSPEEIGFGRFKHVYLHHIADHCTSNPRSYSVASEVGIASSQIETNFTQRLAVGEMPPVSTNLGIKWEQPCPRVPRKPNLEHQSQAACSGGRPSRFVFRPQWKTNPMVQSKMRTMAFPSDQAPNWTPFGGVR